MAPKLCGRPTKAGTPCKKTIYDSDRMRACPQHETDVDVAWREGYEAGYEAAERDRDESDRHDQQLEDEWKRSQDAGDSSLRMTTATGDQIVRCGNYAYAWAGEPPLEVGDKVWLPAVGDLGFRLPERVDEVTALGTTYTGPLKRVVRRA